MNNKLIRRFIPKGSKIELFTAKEIKRIEHWMNHYPRRIFGYKTSNQMVLALSAELVDDGRELKLQFIYA